MVIGALLKAKVLVRLEVRLLILIEGSFATLKSSGCPAPPKANTSLGARVRVTDTSLELSEDTVTVPNDVLLPQPLLIWQVVRGYVSTSARACGTANNIPASRSMAHLDRCGATPLMSPPRRGQGRRRRASRAGGS